MNSSSPHIGIIGGGFAGLAAAVFLDNLGFRVTVLERKPVLGGRAYAFQDKKTGSWVDNGQHLLMGAYQETIKLLGYLGVTRLLQYQNPTHVPLITSRNVKTAFKLPHLPVPFNVLAGLLKIRDIPLTDKWSLIRLGAELNRLKNKLDDASLNQTVESWLIQLKQSTNLRTNFWDILTLATLNDDPNRASARMLAVVLTKGLMGKGKESQLIFPQANLNELLAKPAQQYLEMRGQTIRVKAGIKQLQIIDHQVQKILLTSGEELKFDAYFCATPASALAAILPPSLLQREPYFKRLHQIKSAPIVSINLWFDRDVIPEKVVGVANRQVHWYFNKNKIYQTKNDLYHYMGVVSGAYSLLEKSKEEILRITLSELNELYPEVKNARLVHALVNKEREATFSCTPESEKYRPNPLSPIHNLVLLGDWINTGYPGTIESAVISARMAVDAWCAREHPQLTELAKAS